MGPNNKNQQPTIIVTGASGFVGSSFIRAAQDKYFIYAIAQRSQDNCNIPAHANLQWVCGDISKETDVARIFDDIVKDREIDFILHFAVYYDFYLQDNPIYQRVNVDGTRNLLQQAEKLKLKRFIFSSSLAVSNFLNQDRVIDEQTPADADDVNPYVRTKKEAEKLVCQSADKMPCTIIRMPAIFTDWCEQPPLYALLNIWLQNSWKSNLIVGRGTTAIPFIHIADLIRFLEAVMKKSSSLHQFSTLIASPNGTVSHNDLHAACKQYTRATKTKPLYCPKWLAWLALLWSNILGNLTGKHPFEQLWMLHYIDRHMTIDSSKSQQILDWKPRPCHHIRKRIFFMAKNRHMAPGAWLQKNETWTKR